MIVRRDLPLGLMAAQIVHAAGESSPGDLPNDTHAVVLGVPDEPTLLREEQRLLAAGAQVVSIREPDAGDALTALALRPARREEVRRLVSSLPLLR